MASDKLDFSVGLSSMCQLGQLIDAGEPLAFVHAADQAAAARVIARLQAACEISEAAAWQAGPVIHALVGQP
jgi:thymidine phosphorylase